MWTLVVASSLLLAVVASAGFAPDVDNALKTSSHLYVGTRRKDGSQSKIVPIWFMYDGQAIYFTTTPTSHKAKRIAKGSPLLVWVGSENGPHFEAKAELVRDPAVAEKMAPVYNQKYWIAWMGFFRPRPDRVASGKTLIVKVLPPS